MLALVLTAALALSAPGTLDRSFGHDGRVVTSTSGVPAVAGIESVGGGKVVLAGTVGDRSVVLIRYRRDGSLDRSFGHKGVSTTRFDRDVRTTDTLLDAQGRLLVAGSLGERAAAGRDSLVLRFDRAGHLDPTLDHDGIALIDVGGGASDSARSIALAPDGAIVVAAGVDTELGNGGLGLARLDSSGNLDRTFGQQGFVRRNPNYYFESVGPAAVEVLPDGHLAVAFNHMGAKFGAGGLLRLLPNGSPDPAFDQFGLSAGDWLSGLVAQPTTGRLLLLGSGLDRPDPDVFRPSLMAIDPSSSAPAWRAALELRTGRPVWATELGGLAADSQGRAVVAGDVKWSVTSPNGSLYPALQRADMLVARVRANGRPDRCFGKRGLARVRFPGKLSTAAGIAVGSHGDITIAGPAASGDDKTPHRFELARLRGGNCRR